MIMSHGSSETCQVIVSCQLDQNSISVLLKDIKVLGVRSIAPQLILLVACTGVDMRSQDEFSVAVFSQLILYPLELLFSNLSSAFGDIIVLFSLTIKI